MDANFASMQDLFILDELLAGSVQIPSGGIFFDIWSATWLWVFEAPLPWAIQSWRYGSMMCFSLLVYVIDICTHSINTSYYIFPTFNFVIPLFGQVMSLTTSLTGQYWNINKPRSLRLRLNFLLVFFLLKYNSCSWIINFFLSCCLTFCLSSIKVANDSPGTEWK